MGSPVPVSPAVACEDQRVTCWVLLAEVTAASPPSSESLDRTHFPQEVRSVSPPLTLGLAMVFGQQNKVRMTWVPLTIGLQWLCSFCS